MKALKLRVDDDLYERFKAIHPGYGEESRVFRELLEEYVSGKERQRQAYQLGKGLREWGKTE